MKLPKNSSIVSVVLLSTGFGILALTASFRASSNQEKLESQNKLEKMKAEWQERKERIKAEDIVIENKTQALNITDIKKQDNRLIVTLRNDSQKPITGYEVSVGKGIYQTESLAGAHPHNILLPGETRQRIYPLQVDVDKLGIKVLAVIFDDGTADGDQKYIQEIIDYRLGIKMQHEHTLRLLRKIMNLRDEELATALDKMKAQLSPLTKEEEEKLPPIVKSGLNDERNRAIYIIDEISNSQTMDTQRNQLTNDPNLVKEKLQKLMNFYRNTLKKL